LAIRIAATTVLDTFGVDTGRIFVAGVATLSAVQNTGFRVVAITFAIHLTITALILALPCHARLPQLAGISTGSTMSGGSAGVCTTSSTQFLTLWTDLCTLTYDTLVATGAKIVASTTMKGIAASVDTTVCTKSLVELAKRTTTTVFTKTTELTGGGTGWS
jgi:hypothetical protein